MDCGQFSRATPSAACTMEVQLGAVTSRVCQLEIASDESKMQDQRDLFHSTDAPLLATPPARRPSAPPKSRNVTTPTRRSARQAANTLTVPVARRASFRIVKEHRLLGPARG
ncbi:hypothetical protein D1007_54978 [Hordeum vulgare]|nr:hypothetical protein D1007_54978 [Hordeum vulgare]